MERQINPIAPAAANVAANLQFPAALDAHGFDPNDYDWVPVLRKRRADGWSPEKQRAFIEALADSGSVIIAAQAVGMTERSAYKLRRSPGAESFDRAWSAATQAASKKLLDEAFERALVGSDEPVFNRDGERVGRRFRRSDRMLQFLLRGFFPDQFGHIGGFGGNLADGPAPSLSRTSISEALDRMLPEPLPAPHARLSPDELQDALMAADMLDGKLPHYRRDPDLEPVRSTASPLQQEQERILDEMRLVGIISSEMNNSDEK